LQSFLIFLEENFIKVNFQLIKKIKNLKRNLNFSIVDQIIDNWIEKVELMKSLENYKLSWNDFGGFFKTLNDKVNDYLDNVEKNMPEVNYAMDSWSNEPAGNSRKNKLLFHSDINGKIILYLCFKLGCKGIILIRSCLLYLDFKKYLNVPKKTHQF